MARSRDTQRESWNKCKHEGLSEKNWKVREVIRQRGGRAASFEIAEHLGWSFHCVTGKITNLCDEGKVRDSGQRTVNPKSGRSVILWETCNIKPFVKRRKCLRCHGTGLEPKTEIRGPEDQLIFPLAIR